MNDAGARLCEKIFISLKTDPDRVSLPALVNFTGFGDCMIKSAPLISAALLVFGLTAGGSSMAASMPMAAPMAADSGSSSDAPKVHKHKTSHKAAKSKKTKKPAAT